MCKRDTLYLQRLRKLKGSLSDYIFLCYRPTYQDPGPGPFTSQFRHWILYSIFMEVPPGWGQAQLFLERLISSSFIRNARNTEIDTPTMPSLSLFWKSPTLYIEHCVALFRRQMCEFVHTTTRCRRHIYIFFAAIGFDATWTPSGLLISNSTRKTDVSTLNWSRTSRRRDARMNMTDDRSHW